MDDKDEHVQPDSAVDWSSSVFSKRSCMMRSCRVSSCRMRSCGMGSCIILIIKILWLHTLGVPRLR
eukprot:941262-Pyramimonas_sp.AAC.1